MSEGGWGFRVVGAGGVVQCGGRHSRFMLERASWLVRQGEDRWNQGSKLGIGVL